MPHTDDIDIPSYGDYSIRLDRSAIASRDRITNPYFALWSAMMALAESRVQTVIKWSREWTEHRFEPDYESRRAQVQFHFHWLFDDTSTQRFSFRDLCSFAEANDLQDIEIVRERILQMFEPHALQELIRPCNPRLIGLAVTKFLQAGGIKLSKPRTRTPNAEPNQQPEATAEPPEERHLFR